MCVVISRNIIVALAVAEHVKAVEVKDVELFFGIGIEAVSHVIRDFINFLTSVLFNLL